MPGRKPPAAPNRTGSIQQDLALAVAAADGDGAARQQINRLVEPIIRFQSDQFCKRFCREHRYHFRCTLPNPWPASSRDALLCEWGNGTYGWMLEDLTRAARLRNYRGENDASLYAYLFSIANSRPFYERWKDWRFGRRERAPEFIRNIDPDAARVYLALRNGEPPGLIAQSLGRAEAAVEATAQRIVAELTARGKLHLLTPIRHDSFEAGLENPATPDPAWPGADPADEAERQQLRAAWRRLDPVQQYVLEAMLIDKRDALEVLEALRGEGIALDDRGREPDRQQLYYFRRKALARLARLLESSA